MRSGVDPVARFLMRNPNTELIENLGVKSEYSVDELSRATRMPIETVGQFLSTHGIDVSSGRVSMFELVGKVFAGRPDYCLALTLHRQEIAKRKAAKRAHDEARSPRLVKVKRDCVCRVCWDDVSRGAVGVQEDVVAPVHSDCYSGKEPRPLGSPGLPNYFA